MNLNTIVEVKRPTSADQVTEWRDGYAWLAGGTWLFSEPQPHLNRLIDLASFRWPAIEVDERGLRIAATCTVATLEAAVLPVEWIAAPLIGQCCRAFVASFKIWNTATVGGNICMALPAGPMISLAGALDGIGTVWSRDGGERRISIVDFVTGSRTNALAPGEILRCIDFFANILLKLRLHVLHESVLCKHRPPISFLVDIANDVVCRTDERMDGDWIAIVEVKLDSGFELAFGRVKF